MFLVRVSNFQIYREKYKYWNKNRINWLRLLSYKGKLPHLDYIHREINVLSIFYWTLHRLGLIALSSSAILDSNFQLGNFLNKSCNLFRLVVLILELEAAIIYSSYLPRSLALFNEVMTTVKSIFFYSNANNTSIKNIMTNNYVFNK